MRIAAFQWNGQRHVGVVSADGRTIAPLQLDPQQARTGVQAVIDAGGPDRLERQNIEPILVADVKLEAPLPRPRRNIFCVGRNYHAHARELSATVFKNDTASRESWPIVFTKPPETVIGPYDEVRLPIGISDQVDYESELCVVIGTEGRDISRAKAMRHVFGYTIINDVTARDVQMRHQQWFLGKSFDTFCPMGPWVATADTFDGLQARVRGWVNGELRQDACASDMIFDIPSLIETCSRGITLYPGDVIATGSPAGVGMGMSPPQYLRAGDVVRIEVDGLGAIENRFI